MKNDDAFDLVFDGTQRVLAVFAHPDDLEIFCGGTVARLVDERIGVRAVCVTNGGKGVRNRAVDLRDFLDRRVAAQRRAALALGVEDRQVMVGDHLDLRGVDRRCEMRDLVGIQVVRWRDTVDAKVEIRCCGDRIGGVEAEVADERTVFAIA